MTLTVLLAPDGSVVHWLRARKKRPLFDGKPHYQDLYDMYNETLVGPKDLHKTAFAWDNEILELAPGYRLEHHDLAELLAAKADLDALMSKKSVFAKIEVSGLNAVEAEFKVLAAEIARLEAELLARPAAAECPGETIEMVRRAFARDTPDLGDGPDDLDPDSTAGRLVMLLCDVGDTLDALGVEAPYEGWGQIGEAPGLIHDLRRELQAAKDADHASTQEAFKLGAAISAAKVARLEATRGVDRDLHEAAETVYDDLVKGHMPAALDLYKLGRALEASVEADPSETEAEADARRAGEAKAAAPEHKCRFVPLGDPKRPNHTVCAICGAVVPF